MPSPQPAQHVVEPLGPEQVGQIRWLDHAAFVAAEDPGDVLDFLEWDRTYGIRATAEPAEPAEPAELIGIGTTFSLRLTLPAGVDGAGTTAVPMGGLSWVAVHPGYRRRGVLSALIGHHLGTLHENGEAVSGLFASEPAIYGRFGYGQATQVFQLDLGRAPALRELPGGTDDVTIRFTTADPERHTDLVADLYARSCGTRPGMVDRPRALTRRELRDTPRTLERHEPLRLLIAERGGEPTGYVLLRRELTWNGMEPDGKTEVREVAAVDPPSAHRLWQAVTDFDLSSVTKVGMICPQDPLLTWLVDPRSPRPVRVDALWLRIVDIDRALTGRSYGCEVDLVLDVTDHLCPWNVGRWRLSGGPAGATCTRTTDPADLTLDVRELAAALPGGTTLVALADAGLVTEHTPGAVARLSTAFRSAVAPGTTYIF
jgi:predicted acetyltransferase